MQNLNAALELIKNKWAGSQGIYLYGSRAKGESTPASDIDLAVLSCHPLQEEMKFILCQEAASLFNKDVDLIDAARSPTVLQFQIVSQGQRVACWDAPACEKFEDGVYRMYALLNEERGPLLKDIQKRGKVF